MLKFNLQEDEVLRTAINRFLSSLLPHENFDTQFFTENLSIVLKYVHLDEFKMEHYFLVAALADLNKIKVATNSFEPRLTEDTFQKIVSASISSVISRPELGVTEWLQYEGLDTNLTIPSVRDEVCQKVFVRCVELYRECYEMAVPSEQVMNGEPELRAAFIAHVGTQSINTQMEIVQGKLRLGRKTYSGFSDWLSYTKKMTAEIDNRLSESESQNTMKIDSLEGSYELLRSLQDLLVPIADYGIPELDQYTPILRHRLVVVVGKENIGKTKFAIDKAVNVIMAGGKVAYMCGESVKASIFADVMINFIYKTYGIIIRPEHLTAPEACPDDVRKMIGMSVDLMVTNGSLVLCDAFNYATLQSEMENLYDQTKFDMIVIDHSCALVGTYGDGSLSAKVEHLAYVCRDFKKKFPVCVMVTSHPSSLAKDSAKKGNATQDSPTKGSQNLSTEADEVLYLRDNETLIKQNLILLENTKRRNAGRIVEPVILQKKFEVNAFIYDASLQKGESKLGLEREQALDDLDKMLGTDEDDEDNEIYNLN